MNRATKSYLSAAVILASGIAAVRLQSGLPALDTSDVIGVLFLAALGILSEVLSINVPVGAGRAVSSIGFIPIFASVLLFPAPVELIVCIVMCGVAQLFVHKKPLLTAAFNVSQTIIAISAASILYHSLGTIESPSFIRQTLSFAALAGSFFFLNQLLISVALAFIHETRFGPTFIRMISHSGGNLLYDTLGSPVAIAVATLYDMWWVPGLIVVILPLLLIRHSYLTIHKLQQATTDVLSVLIKTIETRDPYTSGHSVRVSQLAQAIAEDLKLPPSQVDDVRTAALLHDIGKIDTVYADIIGKQSGLTESERGVIVTHAAKGADFLQTLSSFKEHVITSVRHHHERWDGTGYPGRLAGEQIPLAARIIMLCDSIDAMLSDRPYRRALSVEQVRAELLRCAGSQFDPRIVHVILQRNTLERASKLVGSSRQTLPALSAVS